MSKSLDDAKVKTQEICNQYGFSFLEVYRCLQVDSQEWDSYIVTMPCVMQNPMYKYIGFIRADGTYVKP